MHTSHTKPENLILIKCNLSFFIYKSIEKLLSFKRFYVKTNFLVLPYDYVHNNVFVTYILTENLDLSKINTKFGRVL